MDTVDNILEVAVQGIELISTGILLVGFGKSLLSFLQTEWNLQRRRENLTKLSLLRRQLGMYILLGLDFYIVSDIIHSMIRPELNELINLAIIVVLRTTIGFFLGKEVSEIGKEVGE
jgi:uncharacterized membrane protein